MPKLGINNGQFIPCPETPNCVNNQATDKQSFIQPILHLIGTPQLGRDKLLKIHSAWKRTKITLDQGNYFRVEFNSKIFRFIDRVEFYFSLKKPKKIIQFISASRIGRSDFGANRKRIELIRNKFKAY